jgi:iron complex outermembrane receptor protein
MRNVTTYLFLLIISIYAPVFAQKTITGRVTDAEDGKALPGATVKASEIRGTNTDKDGNFTLKNIPDNITSLDISYIGYQSVKTEISSGDIRHQTQQKHLPGRRGDYQCHPSQ